MTRLRAIPTPYQKTTEPDRITIGIDPGTIRLGYAIFSGKRFIHCGSLSVPTKLRGKRFRSERVRQIGMALAEIIKPYPLGVMAIEEPQRVSGGSKGRGDIAMRGLWQSIGFVQAVAAMRGWHTRMVPVEQWRSTCGIRHNMPREEIKSAAMFLVRKLFRTASLGPDEAEAILIGWHAINTKETP